MEQESKLDFYKDVRKSANNNVVNSAQRLDYIIFAVSTGALVVSINYLANSDRIIYCPLLLIISWGLLFSTIILHALSYKKSIVDNKRNIKKLDQWYEKEFQGGFLPVNKEKSGRSTIDEISFWTLVVGIIFLGIFISINLMYNNFMPQEESKTKSVSGAPFEKSADEVLRALPDNTNSNSSGNTESNTNTSNENK